MVQLKDPCWELKEFLDVIRLKFLGGSDGFDPAPNLNTKRKQKLIWKAKILF